MSAMPRQQTIRFTLFDFDSGETLGEVQTLTVDVFTSAACEIFCRLRDYLTYSHDMRFPVTPAFECCRDDRFGQCFFAEALWHTKKFGVMFA